MNDNIYNAYWKNIISNQDNQYNCLPFNSALSLFISETTKTACKTITWMYYLNHLVLTPQHEPNPIWKFNLDHTSAPLSVTSSWAEPKDSFCSDSDLTWNCNQTVSIYELSVSCLYLFLYSTVMFSNNKNTKQKGYSAVLMHGVNLIIYKLYLYA